MSDYQVPQFIEDESRLVGPFTFTQLFILIGGGAIAFIFYKLLKGFIGIPLALIFLFLAIVISFTKINDMPLYKMIIPMVKHFVLPKKYQWNQPRGGNAPSPITEKKQIIDIKALSDKKDLSGVDDLTKILDKGNE